MAPGQAGDRRAIVIGGSMSGLFSALLLRRAGWQADIFERVESELAGRGAGIVTHPELFVNLERAGLAVSREDLGVFVPSRCTLDREGRVVGERNLPQTLTSWDRIFQLMRQEIPAGSYHLGKGLSRVEQTDAKVTAHFGDGSAVEGDLLVGADGFRSSVRGQFAPGIEPSYVGYVAWRGLVDEAALSPEAHAAIFERFAFCLPVREQMLGYPVAGPDNDMRPRHRRFNFVWYRPADAAADLPDLLTDATGRRHEISIPPPLIRSDVIRAMRAAAEELLAPPFAEVVRLTEKPFFQPIYDLEVPRMAFGRVAIVGDAAFVARPHVGAGVSKAAADAAALAESLIAHGNDVVAALTAFERPRVEEGAAIIARARHLGAYMQAQLKTEEERAQAERHRTPEAVMAETATLDFLRA